MARSNPPTPRLQVRPDRRRTIQDHLHPTQFRYHADADPQEPGGMADTYRTLVSDEQRLDQIVGDVLTAAGEGANILVLTTWVDHLNTIAERLTAAGRSVTVLSGGMKAAERRRITEMLATRSTDHLQETSRPVRRPRDTAVPRQDHRDRARLPRRTHPGHRLITKETNARLHHDGIPRSADPQLTTSQKGEAWVAAVFDDDDDDGVPPGSIVVADHCRGCGEGGEALITYRAPVTPSPSRP